MSLFQAKEWWGTWCGGAEEEFGADCLCVANIDNNPDELDAILVGSLNGVLRIFTPKKDGFKAEDLMLELQMDLPILQLESGQFVSGTELPQLCVLHPRKLCVYSVTSVVGSVQHGHHYTINLMYEHKLEHTAFNFTYGKFGAVNDRDFICVQAMDGVLTFYEQETFSFQACLPNFLLPGPIQYVQEKDSFLVGTSGRYLECYKYNSIATSAISGSASKKLLADWSKSLGEHLMDIRITPSTSHIQLLGERSLFTINSSGDIVTMKKLEYNPSCILSYSNRESGGYTTIIGSHNSSLLVYQDSKLVWSAKLPHVPVACAVGKFEELQGVITTLDEYGHLYCSYLGTDPSIFTTPYVESRMSNFNELEKELKSLNTYIKQYESGAGIKSAKEVPESIIISIDVPPALDKVSLYGEEEEKDDQLIPIPSITIKITLQCTTIKPVENITIVCSPKFPLLCATPEIVVPIVGNRGPTITFDVTFYTSAATIPTDLEVPVTATYFSDDAPRILQSTFTLPFLLVAYGAAPVKQANFKLTIDTNKEPVNLAELFPEMVADAVIPVPVLGIQYYGGPVVTILSSKQSNRYRIQSDLFEAKWFVLKELVARLERHFAKKSDGAKFKCVFQGPVPLPDYFELIDQHFEQRLILERYKEALAQRANQFRVIQKRLLTRFKDKTPTPLNHLDTILDGTYKQLLSLGEEYENTEMALLHSGNALSGGTCLINLLIKLLVSMPEKDYGILGSVLTPLVIESTEQGWEEVVSNNIAHILRTSLAKSSKEQNSSLPSFVMERDTSKLKKQLALMCERLNKGASLSTADNTKVLDSKAKKENLSTLREEQDDGRTLLGKRLDDSDHEAVRTAMENVKLFDDHSSSGPFSDSDTASS